MNFYPNIYAILFEFFQSLKSLEKLIGSIDIFLQRLSFNSTCQKILLMPHFIEKIIIYYLSKYFFEEKKFNG